MVSVLIVYIYMFVTTLVLGGAVLSTLCKKELITMFHIEDLCVLGIVVATVYAQIFSIFGKVGFAANALLVFICAFLIWAFRKRVTLFKALFILPKSVWPWIGGILIVILMIYGTSAGNIHVDSDNYHAQAIRWIEEYGLVKGLGNFNTSFAYNSSAFALTALYSFAWITGRSYHACAGFLALIVIFECLRIFPSLISRKLKVSDFVRVGALYYIFNIYDEMLSPESDYFAFLVLFFVVIRMADLAEEGVSDSDAFAIFSLIAISLVTFKLSVAAAIFVSAIPIVMLVKEKRYSRVLLYVLLGVAIVLPYLVRGVIISGYLLFPSTVLDVFNFDWKIPAAIAKMDRAYMIAYGRGYDYPEALAIPFREWFPLWLNALTISGKVIFASAIGAIVFLFVSLRARKEHWKIHIIEAALIVMACLWFLSAPLMRYGQGILLCLDCLVAGDAYDWIIGTEYKRRGMLRKIVKSAVSVAISLFFVYRTVVLGKYIWETKYWKDYSIKQQDYNTYETAEYYIGKITFYTPTQGDLTGYDPFPSTPIMNPNVILRGTEISDGFKDVRQ